MTKAVIDSNRLAAIVTSSADAIISKDFAPDGRWLRVNGRICQTLGYEREELLATTFQHLTHADDLDADLSQLKSLLAGEIDSYTMEKRYWNTPRN